MCLYKQPQWVYLFNPDHFHPPPSLTSCSDYCRVPEMCASAFVCEDRSCFAHRLTACVNFCQPRENVCVSDRVIYASFNPLCLASRWQRNLTNSTGTITMRASWSVFCGWQGVCVHPCSWVCHAAHFSDGFVQFLRPWLSTVMCSLK